MPNLIIKAIKSINPSAEFSIADRDVNKITWINTDPIPVDDITAKQTELLAEQEAQEYARRRKSAYPTLREFAEAYTEKEIGEDSTKWDAYVIKYNQVRNDNPKE